jgi:hypothetical protein
MNLRKESIKTEGRKPLLDANRRYFGKQINEISLKLK